MEKAPIKKFAVEARRKLIADVTFQLERYGITEKGIVEPQTSTDKELVFDLGNGNTQTIKGERYVNQYRNLVACVRGFYVGGNPKQQLEQFIEEIAFTWFNRLIAIRFMEVNRYIPVRVLSSEIEGQKLPDLVASPFSGDLEFTDAEKQQIFDLQDANKEDDLFRFLFFKQCNDLSRILPRLFENLEGHGSYSELLVVLSFSDPNGVVYRLVNEVDECWFDIHATDEEGKPMGQVQIIGWMYQYYNTEPKDKVFADLKKNIKISKQNIPAATQLFTPDWIVRYMVENSLGRLWYEGHPGFDKSEWKYYLDEAPQEPQVEQQLQEIRAQYAKMEPEQLKVIDPCMGSGHILCYLFDVLMQIYLDNGYSKREAVRSILENNLFGLDIDKRAAQIAYFSVMMKAREYDSGFLDRKDKDGKPKVQQPNVYDIQESEGLQGVKKEEIEAVFAEVENGTEHQEMLMYLLNAFSDAKEVGSLLQIKPGRYAELGTAWRTTIGDAAEKAGMKMWYTAVDDSVKQLIGQAILLSQKYDAVVTNPPYMGASNMNPCLNEFIKQNYADYKSDFFSAFVVRASQMTKLEGRCGFFTPYVWMFIQSYEKLRQYLYSQATLETLIQFEYSAFEEATVPVCTFTFAKHHVNKKGNYLRLVDFRGGMKVQRQKTLEAIADHNCGFYYEQSTDNFTKIPGSPVAYWASPAVLCSFEKKQIESCGAFSYGVFTCNNQRFLRLWYEVLKNDIDFYHHELQRKWKMLNKGGTGRRWYGNLEYIINYGVDGNEIKQFRKRSGQSESLPGEALYFKAHISWSLVTSGNLTYRYYPAGMIFDISAPAMFNSSESVMLSTLAVLNSKIGGYYLPLFNPTMNNTNSDIKRIPYLLSANEEYDVAKIVEKNIETSKNDWDSFETSWDFKKHPLV